MQAPIHSESETWQGRQSIQRVKELLAIGVTMTKIAKRFGVSRQAIYGAIDADRKEKAGVRTDDPATSLPVAGGGEEPEHTQPQGDNQNGKA